MRALVELHGYLRKKFCGVPSLDLAYLYGGADFIGDGAGQFLWITIKHDLSEAKGQQVFKTITPSLETFRGLLKYDARSRIPAPKKVEPVDHAPHACERTKTAIGCGDFAGIEVAGKWYCEKHALKPAMEELMELRSRAMTAKQVWNDGADWAVQQIDRDHDNSYLDELERQLRRDMKVANPHRVTPSE